MASEQVPAVHDGWIDVVRGRYTERVDAEVLRRAARGRRVVIDVGAGDGRLVFRLARRDPSVVWIAVDANADGMRETARRALRRPDRGGAANAWFLRAALDELPGALVGIADEILVNLPWGRLLRALLAPDIAGLGHLAALGKPGARFAARVNLSALGNGAKMAQTGEALRLASDGLGYQLGKIELTDEYGQAGLFINPPRIIQETPLTSWGKRLNGRRPATVLFLEGTVEKNKALAGAVTGNTKALSSITRSSLDEV